MDDGENWNWFQCWMWKACLEYRRMNNSPVFDNISFSLGSFWSPEWAIAMGTAAATRQHLVLPLVCSSKVGESGANRKCCRCWLLVNFVAIFSRPPPWTRRKHDGWEIRWDNELPSRVRRLCDDSEKATMLLSGTLASPRHSNGSSWLGYTIISFVWP